LIVYSIAVATLVVLPPLSLSMLLLLYLLPLLSPLPRIVDYRFGYRLFRIAKRTQCAHAAIIACCEANASEANAWVNQGIQ